MNKRTGLLRILTTMLGCVLAFGLVIGLAGCEKSNDEEQIRSAVSQVMDAFKNPTKENLKQFVDASDVNLDELEQYGVDIYEFLGHCFSHFDYKINEVKVEKDGATASLSLTNADLGKAMQAAQEEYMANLDYTAIQNSDNPQLEVAKGLFAKIYEKLDASEDLVTTDATLKLTKVNGEWKLDEQSVNEVVSAMYGGIQL